MCFIHSFIHSPNPIQRLLPLLSHRKLRGSQSLTSPSRPRTRLLTASALRKASAMPCPVKPAQIHSPGGRPDTATAPNTGFSSGVCPTMPVHSRRTCSSPPPPPPPLSPPPKCCVASAVRRYDATRSSILVSSVLNSSLGIAARWRPPPRIRSRCGCGGGLSLVVVVVVGEAGLLTR